ncbi:hypothetical protein RchiOBHm_Chr5g0009061 [Rosa chinensis]|uniref:Uncharacterized protein n=1 Tax=Rosa chinensis TaxID=74649 RepID=A0A2P6Q478_ROSCH|nr:hypothetical protein RchiOBHm_Chr5g0009061 [Rosa chinensis]
MVRGWKTVRIKMAISTNALGGVTTMVRGFSSLSLHTLTSTWNKKIKMAISI